MSTVNSKLISALSIARTIERNLSLHYLGNGVLKSLDSITEQCQQLADRPIEQHELQMSAENSDIKGFCACKPDKYEVVILAGLNTCWTRFITCKELMHAVQDCDEFHNLEIDPHIEEVINFGPDTPLTVFSEFLAEAAAMELLFPFAEREVARTSGLTHFQIASLRKIPEAMVQIYLTDTFMVYFAKSAK